METGGRKRGSKPKRLPMVLDKAEVDKMLRVPNIKCPTGLRNRAILETMWGAGLRVGEVVKLKPGDIRWDAGVIEVRDGKGGKDRTVPLFGTTLGWLRAWKEKRPKSTWFFCTLQGRSLMTRYLQEAVKRIAVKAEVENAQRVSPHTLRHSYATWMLEQGCHIRQVQELLGHSHVGTTQIYLHVRPQHLADKIREIEQRQTLVTNAATPNVQGLMDKLEALPDDMKRMLVGLLSGNPIGV